MIEESDELLNQEFYPKDMEEDIRRRWGELDLKNILIDELSEELVVGYVEGPPTMNGEPHIGHLRGRILKDLWYRFSVLNKQNIVFRAGWDTQGLPVELQAEKELGLSGSKAENLKIVGEEKIVEACKKLIHKYNHQWREADRLLGMSMDYEKAYWTFRDEYIEREWKYLENAWQRGFLGEGFRVVPYCPSCQCSLSHAEVGQGYETVSDPSLYYKVKLESKDRHLVLWTTMPFTVVTDEMVGVKPDEEYLEVKVGTELWIVSANRLDDLMLDLNIDSYQVVNKMLGSELEGLKYEYPLDKYVPKQAELHKRKGVHEIVAEDFVDITTGSGLVHLSPANGEEDFAIAERRGVPVFSPIDDQVKFTSEAGVFQGLFVRDADEKVSSLLEEEGNLIKLDKITHEYPTCWRSHHKLVWTARREYFYWVEKLGDMAIEAAKKVEYFFDAPKNRFIEIIKEKVPWCITRERIWGAPLPIWACQKCGEKTGLFSREEITSNAIDLPDGPNFELHRPWIDRVKVKCGKCGGVSIREPFVLDTWHNSGAAPYAAFNDDEHRKLIPVEFLTEGIDQTRGWAYTLLIENVILKGKPDPPYKAFLFQGHILDEKGNKMSKSLGNMVDGIDALRSNSVDMIRFYMTWKASPIDSLNFSFKEMTSRPYQILSTLYHLHVYFQHNSRYDGFDFNKHNLDWAESKNTLKLQEKWLLSRLQSTIRAVTNGNRKCRYQDSARAIEKFLIDDLSQTYVPLTRREIWNDNPDTLNRRLSIYSTLANILMSIDILLHPISPYLTEHLYRKCFRLKETVLLESWPEAKDDLMNKKLEEQMADALKLISLINSAKMKAKLKRRWPLRKIYAIGKDMDKLSEFRQLIEENGNVKDIKLSAVYDNSPITLKITPRYEILGKKLKEKMGEFTEQLSRIEPWKLYSKLNKDGNVSVKIGEEEVRILDEELRIEYISKDEKHIVIDKDGITIALDIERDPQLISEGNLRDLARRLQTLRKERGYNPTDIIKGAYITGLDNEWKSSILPLSKELAFLVRVKSVKIFEDKDSNIHWSDAEIDGNKISISVE